MIPEKGCFVQNLTLVWVAAIFILVVIELATTGLTTIWFAAGALIALVLSLLHVGPWIQIAVFLVSSLLFLLLTRPLANRYVNRKTVRTNAESLIGQEAVISEPVDNLASAGTARVNGQEWSARSAESGGKIAAGTVVEIERIEGVKLIVRPKE